MNSLTTKFLKGAVISIGALVFILCVVWLPTMAKYSAELFPEFAYLKWTVLVGLYLTAIPFGVALFQAFKLLTCIEKKHAFSGEAIGSLGRIKLCALMIMVIYVLGMIFLLIQNALHPGIAILGMIISFASATISVFAAVLQQLLQNALELKSENDLTV
ncbi:DUF2975 domain-containing protein [Bacillus sp. KH172YL63]|uniref:DUF2975 domain-containing protein n=1 Tax=Bacillus sp. KH172YL63 TaxID=2709784 RepID=UPI0013E4F12D|nr:DUF2975 domain-containing protein [Bacillus sp. KH172YL63]BCB03647.1 putative membrane protein YoaS [Bacillus sp. KH172YL63]